MKNEWFLGFLFMMTLFGSLGSVFFNFFAIRRKKLYLLAGFMFYGLGALLNIYLLKELPYTLVMPANALGFIWTLLFAKWFFKETVGVYKIAGVAFIISGLLLLLM